MMRTQIPKFRLPDAVIDEECDYILNLGIEFKGGKRIDSLKALLAENYDAIFVGSGAPRGRELDIPGRKEAAKNIHIGIDWLSSRLVRPHHADRQARHRAGRRQHRDGLLPHLAPARRRRREGDRALRLRGDEGVPLGEGGRHARGHPDPQLPGAEGIHPRQRQADRRHVREGQGRIRRQGPAQPGADRRAGPAFRLRRRAGRGRPGERLPLDRARHRHRVRQVGHAQGRSPRPWPRPTRRCSSAATRRSARRTSSGRWRTATTPRCRSTRCCPARTSPSGRCPTCRSRQPEDGHPRVELRQRHLQRQALQGAAPREGDRAEGHPGRGRARLRPQARLRRGAALPELRRPDRVHRAALHRVRRLRRHLPDGLHHLHAERRGGRPADAAAGARRRTSTRTSTSPTA